MPIFFSSLSILLFLSFFLDFLHSSFDLIFWKIDGDVNQILLYVFILYFCYLQIYLYFNLIFEQIGKEKLTFINAWIVLLFFNFNW